MSKQYPNLVPYGDKTQSLGTSTKAWNEVHAGTVSAETVTATTVEADDFGGGLADIIEGLNKSLTEHNVSTEAHEDIRMAITTAETTAKDASNITLNLNSIVTNLLGDSAGSHNSFFRGKYLGSEFTEAQSKAIQAGTFDDIFVGDYWTINGVNWRVAHLDYWLHTGDTECTTHHAVIVPDSHLYTAQMNTTSTTAGGYVGSAMYTTNLATAKSTIEKAFGSGHILKYRDLFVNTVANGKPTQQAWYDAGVELMNEMMVYGCRIDGSGVSDGSTWYANHTISKSQLKLFDLEPRFQITSGRQWYWLRDVTSSTSFARVGGGGNSFCDYASNVGGVRPAFPIY